MFGGEARFAQVGPTMPVKSELIGFRPSCSTTDWYFAAQAKVVLNPMYVSSPLSAPLLVTAYCSDQIFVLSLFVAFVPKTSG
jgi:hypothetical protein